MTRDEVKLVVFILVALLAGTAVKFFRESDPLPQAAAPTPAPRGWAKPPYVFKDARDARNAVRQD